MRRILFIILLGISEINDIRAKVDNVAYDQVSLLTTVARSYNSTTGFYGEFSGLATYRFTQHINIYGGYRLTTGLIHTLQGGTTLMFPIRERNTILLENCYSWGGWTKYNIQEINSILMVGVSYRNRLIIKVGIFNKFFTTIHHSNHNPDWVFEPFNMVYSIEFWIRKYAHRFNAGIKICNIEDFVVERAYSPSLLLNFRYRLNPRLTFYSHVRIHNSGIFDCTNNYYEDSFRFGTKISW